MLALAVPTALLIALVFLLFWLAGAPVGGPDDTGFMSDFLVAIFLAAGIALFQIAALAVLRMLPWPNPQLKVDGEADEDRLKRVFE